MDNKTTSAASKDPSRPIHFLVWGGLAVVIAIVVALFVREGGFQQKASYPVVATVQPFSLTNQLGEPVTLETLRGHVWVADVIFTRCGGPCPTMTREMATLARSAGPNARFVTLTTDPENDTPTVMKEYSARFEADPKRWSFLTGPKKEIARLAVQDLKFTTMEKDPGQQENENDLFIHSSNFMVVDKKGRVRASVESLEPFAQDTLLKIIKDLEREPAR